MRNPEINRRQIVTTKKNFIGLKLGVCMKMPTITAVSRQDGELVSIQEESTHLQDERFAGTSRRSGKSTKGVPPELYVVDGKLAQSQQCEP